MGILEVTHAVSLSLVPVLDSVIANPVAVEDNQPVVGAVGPGRHPRDNRYLQSSELQG